MSAIPEFSDEVFIDAPDINIFNVMQYNEDNAHDGKAIRSGPILELNDISKKN
jgi:hypothetical protein